MKIFKIEYRFNKKIFNFFTFSIIFFILFINLTFIFNLHFSQNGFISFNDENPKNSATWATLDLTNPAEINNTQFPHNSTISIKGRLYIDIPPTFPGISGYNVSIEIDDVLDIRYKNITDINGYFQINYIIDPSLDVYSSHKLNVSVIDSTPSEVEYPDFYIINVNTTSYFDIVSYDDPTIPKLTEEYFAIDGYLKNGNGTGLSDEEVYYYWLDGFNIINQGSFWTGSSGDLLDIQVPDTLSSQLTLKLNFSNIPYIGYSENSSLPIKVFSDVAWDLDIDLSTYVGARYTITGQLSSLTDSSLKINNRSVEILYDGNIVDTVQTRADGTFTSTFDITGSNGTFPIQVQLVNYAAKDISSTPTYIFVDVALPSNGGAELPPFLIFSVIFFPILSVIIAVLIVYALRYYRKQEEESRVVNVPLISRIKNLKILKDSGRLEESLSYLFNAIYMDLVNAKYGRARKDNETIRDFAIVSVKELKLTPATVYPFIQKIEEVIYAKPFKITEKDFYKTCELFSPIYFQLTGYNFVLNF